MIKLGSDKQHCARGTRGYCLWVGSGAWDRCFAAYSPVLKPGPVWQYIFKGCNTQISICSQSPLYDKAKQACSRCIHARVHTLTLGIENHVLFGMPQWFHTCPADILWGSEIILMLSTLLLCGIRYKVINLVCVIHSGSIIPRKRFWVKSIIFATYKDK